MASSLRNNRSQGAQNGKIRSEFRTTPKGVVPLTISSLGKLILDPAMQAALTHASAKLVVEMDAGGTRVLLADQRTSQLIGGPEDLQKLGSIRAFVGRERKEAATVEAARDVTQLAFLAEKLVKDTTLPGFQMKPVDNSYGAAVRPLLHGLHLADENLNRVLENTSETNRELFEPELKRLFVGCKNAYSQVICAATSGHSIKGMLKEQLFLEGVPDWVHTRFVSKSFTLERTGDLEKVIFPSDPTKGLALTVKEWRDTAFVSKQGPLTRASTLVYEIVNSDKLIKAITGIADTISLEDEENPQVARLLGSKLVAMPPATTADRVIELGSKSKSGFKFPTPSMDTITGSMVAISTALLRIYSANLQSVDLVTDYYGTIVPGAVRREDVSPTNNFYVQWGKAANKSAVWLEAIRGFPENINLRQHLWRWIRTELRLSETAPAGKALAETLLLEENGSVPITGHIDGVIPASDPNNLVFPREVDVPSRTDEDLNPVDISRVLLRELKPTEVPFWNSFQEKIFPPAVGKKRQPVGVALTPLTAQGKQLLNKVKQISPYVAERMVSWLRSFSDERLQLAAIRVTNAEFDDIFSSSLDEDDAQSEQDWAEQEA